MKDTFTSARLVAPDLIRLIIFSSVPYDKLEVTLVKDRHLDTKLTAGKITSTASLLVADFPLHEPLPLGHSYALSLPSYGLIALDVSEATTFPGFDEAFLYEGDDLGATYGKSRTTFVLWAPLASFVWLKIRKRGVQEWSYFEMVRFPSGIYRYIAQGDYEGAEYLYCPTNSELTSVSSDPYAKGSMPDGEASVVVDPSKFLDMGDRESLPVLNNATDAVIYEGNVRDLTIDRHSDIVHKGRFLGLSEEGRRTDGGNPAGLDYITSLGITHLQLQPLFDFKTVDERHPERNYNWGYDPAQYFVPEGSYASNVEDPYSRIIDLQKLVKALHSKGIRVSMDCVYNHVYEYSSSSFERIVPNYYFRRKSSGRMANTSYCGDDFATERPMARKLILDCCRYWIKTYGIDAFRFDLMGIMDVETMKEIGQMAKGLDPSFLLYGEGWSMGGEIDAPFATMDNASLLPQYGFFNDRYRDSFKRWIGGDSDSGTVEAVSASYVGSALDFYLPKKFLSAEQSLNYIECHDNETFYDYLKGRNPSWSEEELLSACRFGISSVLTSFGIPFIHAGQELGQSKFGKGNTYNLPDVYNKFSYRLLDERKAMYDYFKGLVLFRKRARFLHVYDPRVIDSLLEVESSPDGLFKASFRDGASVSPNREVILMYNPTRGSLSYPLGSACRVVVDASGTLLEEGPEVERAYLPPHSFMAFRR